MTATPPPDSHPPVRPWEELRSSGLLWLINTTVLHPRGFAMAVVLGDGDKLVGWQLLGDGTEPWRFADGIADEPFAAVEAFFAAHRAITAPGGDPMGNNQVGDFDPSLYVELVGEQYRVKTRAVISSADFAFGAGMDPELVRLIAARLLLVAEHAERLQLRDIEDRHITVAPGWCPPATTGAPQRLVCSAPHADVVFWPCPEATMAYGHEPVEQVDKR